MLLVRRIPGVIYNHKYAAVSCSSVFVTVVYLLFHWRFVCSNIEPWNHVNNLVCNNEITEKYSFLMKICDIYTTQYSSVD